TSQPATTWSPWPTLARSPSPTLSPKMPRKLTPPRTLTSMPFRSKRAKRSAASAVSTAVDQSSATMST
ncbi:hypothetical protein E4U43_002198, partial [Claviceps pusilla]